MIVLDAVIICANIYPAISCSNTEDSTIGCKRLPFHSSSVCFRLFIWLSMIKISGVFGSIPKISTNISNSPWTIHEVSTSVGSCVMLTSSQSSNVPYSRLRHLEEAKRKRFCLGCPYGYRSHDMVSNMELHASSSGPLEPKATSSAFPLTRQQMC